MGRKLIVACALLALLPCIAWGQGYGSISGSVSDPSGAVVPGATVTAVEVGTKAVATAKSSTEGRYQILQLRPGLYAIDAEAPGFKKLSRPDIRVDVAGRITLDLQLEVGGTSETVAVTAEAPLLRTEDAQTGEVINETMLRNLPQLDRNPLTLLRLSGLVSGTGVAGNGDYDDLRVSGGRTGSLDYAVDGQNISSGRGHNVLSNAIPTMESVAEFKVITNGMSAEYGRSSGGIVEVATRGGTNELHGQGFEYFRNELLNANSWLQNATGGQRQVYKQNIFGGEIGGPVFLPKLYNGRNKTFWYFNYQGTKYREAAVNKLAGVPTAEERNGDLTHTLYNGSGPMLWDPIGGYTGSGYGNQFLTTLLGGDGLHVPKSRISPMSQAIIDQTPLPNRPSTPGFSQVNNYVGQSAYLSNASTWTARVDENFTDKQRLSLRFKRDNNNNLSTSWLGPLSPGWSNKMKQGLNSNLTYDYTVSPTLLLTARAGATASPADGGPAWPSSFKPADFPYDPSVKAWTTQDRLPFSTIIGSNGGWGGTRIVNADAPHSDILSYNNFNASLALTKVWNKHTIKVGGEHRRYYDNFLESGLGWMAFNGFATLQNDFGGEWVQTNPNMVAANAWGDFLLGMLNQTQQSAPWTMALNFNYWAGFVQDDWKVTPNLTFNLGMRWDTETPVTERNEKLVAWDPNAPSAFSIPSGWNWNSALSSAGLTASQIAMFQEPQWAKDGKYPNGAMAVAGTSQYPGRSLQQNHWNHFAPRFGAAYRLNNKTTLRASGAVMYISATGGYYSMWTTVVPATSAVGPYDARDSVTGVPTMTWDHIFSPQDYSHYQHTVQEANYQVGGNLGGPVYSIRSDMPREYEWNLTVQRQITPNMIAEASYAGNHSGTLLVQDDLNPFSQQYLKPELATLLATKIANPVSGQLMANDTSFTGATVPLGALLNSNPSRGYLSVQGLNGGSSMYNAINLRLERRMSNGIAFLVNYTLSKSLDDVGGPNESFWGGGSFNKGHQITDTYRNVYGYSPIDRTHRLVWYHDVQLPFGRGRKFMGHPQGSGGTVLDHILGGWELAGNAIYTSGTPITFGSTGGVSSQDQGAPGLNGFVLGSTNQLKSSAFSNSGSLLRSPGDSYTTCGGAFNCSMFGLPQQLTYGSMGSVYPWIRNPGYFNYDASLMKSFKFTEQKYLQLRVEAENVFNIRGLGNYDTTFGDAYFGYITGAGNTPRRMQVSGRIYF